MAEVDDVKRDIDELRGAMNTQLSGVRDDIKDLTKALRDLIRLDGDLKRIQDGMIRIGREVDDHEDRLRVVENGRAGDEVRIGGTERIAWLFVSAAVGVMTFVLTH